MKIFFIRFVFLLLCVEVSAQHSHGIVAGANYAWYNQLNANEEHTPGFGWQLGYGFDWQLASKWHLGAGGSVNLYNITTKYEPRGDENTAPNYFASFPLTGTYKLSNKLGFVGGYQFGYLLETDIANANRYDHAALVGLNYYTRLGQIQLNYRQSLNTEIEYPDSGVPPELYDYYTITRNKIYGFQLSLFIPLNHKKGWDE
jgi:hypothetical protein